MITGFADKVFDTDKDTFSQFAIDLFHFQYQNNKVYRAFTDLLGVTPPDVTQIKKIPFLPISLFKSQPVQTTSFNAEMIFESSGTTQSVNSRHYIKDLALYRKSFIKGFENFYGRPDGYCIIGLLPSYLERSHSSLVYMVDELIKTSNHPQSGFYLHEYDQLASLLQQLENKKQQTLLIGVTFALLDFAEQFPMQLAHTIIMETGGMKGRREEITRPALHETLKEKLGTAKIHSEYGMTELLSQAYSTGDGFFKTVPWMKVFVRDDDDPLDIHDTGNGILNIIDLANIYSCAFIATDDVGKIHPDGKFEVMGRLDNSDMRGCSLLTV